MMLNFPRNKKIILFDGVCNLCNSTVKYIIKHDKKDVFRFVALQSELGKAICKHIGLTISKMDSLILYNPGIAYFYKSSAVIAITNEFSGAWKLFSFFKIIPRFLRDSLYDLIAKNRYKLYGKKENCMIPTPELRAKFL